MKLTKEIMLESKYASFLAKNVFKIQELVKKSNDEDDKQETLNYNLMRFFSSHIDSFDKDLQEIYKTFSTQGFLASPLPIPRVGEYKVFHPQTFFDWRTTILTRNIGRQFQTVQIETFIIVLHYCLNGGFINKEINNIDCVELTDELRTTYDYFGNFTKNTKYAHSIE